LRDAFNRIQRIGIDDLEIIQPNLRLASEDFLGGGDHLRRTSFSALKLLPNFL